MSAAYHRYYILSEFPPVVTAVCAISTYYYNRILIKKENEYYQFFPITNSKAADIPS